MFNPQRKVKHADIYMQEKAYSLHLRRMAMIDNEANNNERYEDSQEKYL